MDTTNTLDLTAMAGRIPEGVAVNKYTTEGDPLGWLSILVGETDDRLEARLTSLVRRPELGGTR